MDFSSFSIFHSFFLLSCAFVLFFFWKLCIRFWAVRTCLQTLRSIKPAPWTKTTNRFKVLSETVWTKPTKPIETKKNVHTIPWLHAWFAVLLFENIVSSLLFKVKKRRIFKQIFGHCFDIDCSLCEQLFSLQQKIHREKTETAKKSA